MGAENGSTVPGRRFSSPCPRRPLPDYATLCSLAFFIVLSFPATWRLVNSPLWRVLVIIRENEERAQFLGYNTFRYKLAVLLVAGFFAGVAGTLQGRSSPFSPRTCSTGRPAVTRCW